jgi:hypothetical protein
MFDEARNERVRMPGRDVVRAAYEFLPATPLDPHYLGWLATHCERLPEKPPSYLALLPRAGASHRASRYR